MRLNVPIAFDITNHLIPYSLASQKLGFCTRQCSDPSEEVVLRSMHTVVHRRVPHLIRPRPAPTGTARAASLGLKYIRLLDSPASDCDRKPPRRLAKKTNRATTGPAHRLPPEILPEILLTYLLLSFFRLVWFCE